MWTEKFFHAKQYDDYEYDYSLLLRTLTSLPRSVCSCNRFDGEGKLEKANFSSFFFQVIHRWNGILFVWVWRCLASGTKCCQSSILNTIQCLQLNFAIFARSNRSPFRVDCCKRTDTLILYLYLRKHNFWLRQPKKSAKYSSGNENKMK